MEKIDLLETIANLPDDATILFGDYSKNFIGGFADLIIYDKFNNHILITNKLCDSVPNEYGKVIFEDETEEE